jgi:hypothetical protein
VGECVDSSVLVHDGLHRSCVRSQTPASTILAAGTAVLAASLRHAKITPALLQRGDQARRRCKVAEAFGSKPEFRTGDFIPAAAPIRPEVEQAAWLARSYARSARYLSPSNRQRPARSA